MDSRGSSDLAHLRPPVSSYQVVVVVVDEDTSHLVRRRELGAAGCFLDPKSYREAEASGTPHYCAAELSPSRLPEATPFTVGDSQTYGRCWNSPLDPTRNYLVYIQASSSFRGVRPLTAAVFLLHTNRLLTVSPPSLVLFPHSKAE